MKKHKKIALVGGGTGGHVIPLLNVYKYATKHKKLDADYIWIGENNSLEQQIARDNKIDFFSISAGKLHRYASFDVLLTPFRLLKGIFQSIRILRQEKIDIIFSKGGYVSLPLGIASWFTSTPLMLHESDSIPGLANRIVARFAKKIFINFKEVASYFAPGKTEQIEPLISEDLYTEEKPKTTKKTQILVLCGSQGASRVFDGILQNISMFKDVQMHMILGLKNPGYKTIFSDYPYITTYNFISQKDLGKLYKQCDVVITRASSALFEMEKFGMKMVIVPLPESGNNHQFYNAKAFAKKKGNIMIEQSLFARMLPQKKTILTHKKKEQEYVFSTKGFDAIIETLL